MNKFQTIKLDNGLYDFLVIATSYENPLSSLVEITEEANTEKARLLFDLTLINGTKKNRYVACNYEKYGTPPYSCSIVESVDDGVKNISRKYFSEHADAVQDSVIPNALKFLIRTEGV
jgi:hypothetical protein